MLMMCKTKPAVIKRWAIKLIKALVSKHMYTSTYWHSQKRGDTINKMSSRLNQLQ